MKTNIKSKFNQKSVKTKNNDYGKEVELEEYKEEEDNNDDQWFSDSSTSSNEENNENNKQVPLIMYAVSFNMIRLKKSENKYSTTI